LNTTDYLLDTNVISETRKRQPNSGVLAFLTGTNANQLFLSVLTLGELRRGVRIKHRTDPAVADQLGEWVDRIESTFADRILGVDTPVAKMWGDLSTDRSLPVVDTLIASTALTHRLTLVTRNRRDVAATGVALLDPWKMA
jgi:toxin FitB